MRNNVKKALMAIGLSSDIGALAAGVTLTTRIPVCPTGGPGAPGDGSPATVSTVSSTYGVYTLLGCYAAPSSGYLLDGKTTVSAGMTLASCASFCAGSTAFAVQNGNQCLCGSQSPTAAQLDAGSCGSKCSGNGAENCGSSSSGIVYTSPPRGGQVSVTTYATTLPNGVVTTITSSTTLPPSPSGSVSVATYTTTDANGSQMLVMSSTTLTPPPPGLTSTTTYVTTDSAGSSFTTTRTTVVAPPVSSRPPATTVIVMSSTNAQGSVVITSSTSTALGPSSSEACGGTYRDRLGGFYHLDCSLDYPGYDLPTQTVADFESCIEACDNYVPSPDIANGTGCVGFSAGYRTNSVECYLKYNIIETRYDFGEDSAYKLGSGVNPQAPLSSSSAPSNAQSTTLSNRPVSSSSNNANVPSTRTTAPTSAGSVNPTAATQPCPSSNGQPFIDQQGTVFDIACQVQYPGYDLTTPHYDTFQDCILACDNYVPDPAVANGQDCVAVSWGYGNVGGNCYLKYFIGEVRSGGPNDACARLHNTTLPSSMSSSSPSVPPTSTSQNVPVPATTSSNTTWATTPTTLSTSNPLPVTSTSSSSTFSPSAISGTADCPSQNGDIYTDTFGNQYELHCGVEINGDNAQAAAHADTFEKCVAFCDLLPNCTAVTYPGDVGAGDAYRSNCYPYTSFINYIDNSNPTLRSARPLGGRSNTGTNFNNVTLCPSYDQRTFTDPANHTYNIGCEQGLYGAGDLFATVLPTLEACATYCSLYNTCIGVTFTSYIPGSRTPNCYPRSTNAAVTSQAGNSTAYILT